MNFYQLLLLLGLSVSLALGIKVADILESEKVTSAPILQNKRVNSRVKVADIFESERVSTLPTILENKKVTPESPSSGKAKEVPISKRYPLITMREDYNKEIPPKPKEGGPVQVDFYILLIDIRDINEVEEELTAEYNLQIFWKDERLTQWDRNSTHFLEAKASGRMYEVISTSIMSDIWHPDVFIDHLKKMDQHKVLKTPTSLRLYYSDGTFRFSGRFTMKIACQMEFHYYPADTQRCPVKMKSYAYNNRTVFIHWRHDKKPAMRKGIMLPNFQVGIGGALQNKVATSSNTYSEITFIVILRRFLGFHLIQTYLPSCLFVVISFLTFLVSSESVLECLTLCMTTLLTLTAMFASVKQNTPTVSYVKGLDIWMVTCIFCVFFTLVEHTVLLKLRTQITEKAQKQLSEKPGSKKPSKRRRMFSLTPIGRGKQISRTPKHTIRPSQESHAPFYDKSFKDEEAVGSDSGSETSPNVQLRRYPQPTPPAPAHLTPSPPLAEITGLTPTHGNTSISPAAMAHRLSISPCHSPMMMNADFLSSLTPDFASLIQKNARKRFNFSRSIEILFSKLIPISFLLFNVIYWPWLLYSADYYNNTAFVTTKYV